MRVGTVPTNWDRLVVRQHELATTQTYDLNDDWKQQSAEAYPTSKLNIMDWPSMDSISDKQDETPTNEGDATANEGANAQADATLAGGNNNKVNEDNEAKPILALNPMIDLSTIGLRRSERVRKPAKRMNLMAMIKGSACFLPRHVDRQQQQQ